MGGTLMNRKFRAPTLNCVSYKGESSTLAFSIYRAHKFLDQGEVSIQQCIREASTRRKSRLSARSQTNDSRAAIATLVVRVPYIVDADPEREHRVRARPRRSRRLARHTGAQELIHLVRHGQHGRLVWRDEGRVDGGAAVCEVVGHYQRFVVLHGDFVDPVCAAYCSVSLNTG